MVEDADGEGEDDAVGGEGGAIGCADHHLEVVFISGRGTLFAFSDLLCRILSKKQSNMYVQRYKHAKPLRLSFKKAGMSNHHKRVAAKSYPL